MVKRVVVVGLAVALSLLRTEAAVACSAAAPQDDALPLLALGAVGTGFVLSGVAIALRPPKKTQPAAREDSTLTLSAS